MNGKSTIHSLHSGTRSGPDYFCMIALTHVPSPNLQTCERTYVPHTAIDHARAIEQHAAYCSALRECGASVRTLDVSSELADSVFIEDTAIVLDEIVVLCSMGASSRREEPRRIEAVLRQYREIGRIELPATIEGGDVLRTRSHAACRAVVPDKCIGYFCAYRNRKALWVQSAGRSRLRLLAS